MTELGPFRVNPDGKTLWYNKDAWNNESPAGVGFSYSNRSSDYITGDKQTAADSYAFLVNWLERFPEYKSQDFYIAGESYAELYHESELVFQIGNAYIDYIDRWMGTFDHFWTSALISDETHEGIVANCNFSTEGSVSQACEDYQDKAYVEKGGVYIYDIYAPLCGSSSKYKSNSLSCILLPKQISNFDPCSDDYVFTYLNAPEVQKALHADRTGVPVQWEDCNDAINIDWQDQPDTVLPVINKLMASGIRVWIYSGDTDGIIHVTTTRHSMAKLGAPVKTPWYPWYSQGEVGGYIVGYQNVTFVTIRGAGHFVPSYQPERALTFFSSFIEGKLPPGQN
ncbi:Serine carboxypeptidases (lysosomal cathepsin A) [Handroanthus impetiginosus]|uniref:Serine carboxypeptidases (Lysosomal cathepsin A) n=1 Tax=Handroanthus impetiginosus TaxID=429701 RepID=A0A2G9GJ49_9LAMI|nr:Serine carboxypeptidases (lysosomal cathepsin A) [Handroanthus impetiginosus]